jgi:hypothetical protein
MMACDLILVFIILLIFAPPRIMPSILLIIFANTGTHNQYIWQKFGPYFDLQYEQPAARLPMSCQTKFTGGLQSNKYLIIYI